MATIADIEDDIITTIAALKDNDEVKLFRIIDSLGRKKTARHVELSRMFCLFCRGYKYRQQAKTCIYDRF